MSYSLMIVESPTKIATIRKVLSKNSEIWKLRASGGHILNLNNSKFGLDFSGEKVIADWVYEDSKRKFIKEIKELAVNAKEIYIATDDDREGERIAKDIIEKANIKSYKRITFTEITERAILGSLENYRFVKDATAETAKARRYIDRDSGWGVSEILKFWLRNNGYSYPNKLAVGRSISTALHLLAENQKKIEEFVPEEYYRIKVWYQKGGHQFQAIDKVKFMTNDPGSMEQLKLVVTQLKTNPHIVQKYDNSSREQRAPQPLYTSTAISSAFYLYAFRGKHTMKLAQDLFQRGYISYTRTDSNYISDDAYMDIIEFLYEHYEDNEVLNSKANYSKRKNAQEAHECIRPTYYNNKHSPENIMETWKDEGEDEKLTEEHRKLYELIWYRTIATQMAPAIYNESKAIIDILGNKLEVRSNNVFETYIDKNGKKQEYKGWLKLKEGLLKTSIKDENESFKEEEVRIPEMEVDEELTVIDITILEDKTRAPYHYGEGRFIQKLESMKIARPSTLASIIPSLEEKGCIKHQGSILKVMKLGFVVDDWLTEFAPWLNDPENAIPFEERLEELEASGEDDSIQDFTFSYHQQIEDLKKTIGFVSPAEGEPSEAQVNLANNIASQLKIKLPEDVLKNKEKISGFIEKYTKKRDTENSLGKCPECKTGKVIDRPKMFSCNQWKTKKCGFTVWKSTLVNWFLRFGKETDDEYLRKLMEAGLNGKAFLCKQLRKANDEPFDASIIIRKDEQWGWGITFDKSRKLTKKSTVIEETKKEIEKFKEDSTIDKQKFEEQTAELEKYKNQSVTDPLTQLFNRNKMDEDLKNIFKNDELRKFISITFIDGDRFKGINDKFGHQTGDEVLKYIAKTMKAMAAEFKGGVYRYGGEEFLIVCVNRDRAKVLKYINDIREKIHSERVIYQEHSVSVTISAGLSYCEEGDTIESLVNRADKAVICAKERGRNQVVVFQKGEEFEEQGVSNE